MASNRTFDTGPVLQVIVGAFLVTLGIAGIMEWDGSEWARNLSRAFGRPSDPFNLIVAILELAAGAIIVVGALVKVQGRAMYAAMLAVTLLWLLLMILSHVAQDIFEPDVLTWVNVVTLDGIVLFSLWGIHRGYA